ncbi:hypothetical protein ABEB36_013920 [Hypothenemus hampei]|uniref:Uncharacterized protein n=1 Tax=Hypothenemus hampei TaxID=57062 RepID=A0ABD1E5X1_HYPHA
MDPGAGTSNDSNNLSPPKKRKRCSLAHLTVVAQKEEIAWVYLMTGKMISHILHRLCGQFTEERRGYPKAKVFEHHPRTIDELKAAIRQEIAEIPPEMTARVMDTFRN